MKALSIKQPWAWLICAGYKDIENRHWRIGRKPSPGFHSQMQFGKAEFPFRIYVHAGKTVDHNDLDLIGMNAEYFHIPVTTYAKLCMVCENWKDGAIIGEVDITGCVEQSNSPWFVGKYGFTLSQPILYNVPIPYRGQLGFFEVHLDDTHRDNQTRA